MYRLGASGSQHLIQGLEQRRKLELVLNHGFLCAQHRRVGIFIRNQQPPGALVNHFVNPPQQAILLAEPLKGDRISNHNAHRAICRVIELLLHALKYRIQVLGGGRSIVRRILEQPHKGIVFRDKALHCELRELCRQNIIRQHQALQLLGIAGTPVFSNDHGYGTANIQRHFQGNHLTGEFLPARAAPEEIFQCRPLQKALHPGIAAVHFNLLQLGTSLLGAFGDFFVNLG